LARIDGEAGISLKINDRNLGLVKSMPHDFVNVGQFPAGKGLDFYLVKYGKARHYVNVLRLDEIGKLWSVTLGLTATNPVVDLIVKLVE